jgi:ubiquinone/menaquinone biosynthesis C-methylase UbiE
VSSALYDGFIADYYDESPIVRGRTQDVAFYRDAVHEYGDPVLELGCGTGRITLALAEAGHRVTGLDISEKMLERCNQKRAALLTEARERVHLVQGDMTRFDLGEKFRVVIIPFRPLQHLLEIDAQISCLDSVRRHLQAAGRRFDPRCISNGRGEDAPSRISGREPRYRIRYARRAARENHGARRCVS